jgi:DNA-binding CsgD family transcriptional regulator
MRGGGTNMSLSLGLRRVSPGVGRERPPTAFEESLRQRFSLTCREGAVAASLVEGLSYSEIAQRLGISYHTVHTHVKAIHHKAHVSSNGRLLALIWS